MDTHNVVPGCHERFPLTQVLVRFQGQRWRSPAASQIGFTLAIALPTRQPRLDLCRHFHVQYDFVSQTMRSTMTLNNTPLFLEIHVLQCNALFAPLYTQARRREKSQSHSYNTQNPHSTTANCPSSASSQ